MIDYKISQYVENQFPEFYREEGQNFIAFMKAYYEWLELPENTTYKTKHLLEWADVDKTIDQFILYFKGVLFSTPFFRWAKMIHSHTKHLLST
jgi:hypothetical protein